MDGTGDGVPHNGKQCVGEDEWTVLIRLLPKGRLDSVGDHKRVECRDTTALIIGI